MSRGGGRVFRQPTSKYFWIQFSVNGRICRESSRSTKVSEARALLNQRLADAHKGRLVGAEVTRTTLRDLGQMLLDDYRAHGRASIDRIEDALKHLFAFFGEDARAVDIGVDRITAYIAYRQRQTYKGKAVASATVNVELAALRRAFRLAARAGRVAARPEFEMLRTDNIRKGFFAHDEFEAVVAALPTYLKPVARTAYVTGWRTQSELITRQWRHVDLDSGWLRLDPGEGKTREPRAFPLTPELRAILEAQRECVHQIEKASGVIVPWVFCHDDGTPIRNFRYAWAKACRAAGVPDRLVHDLRRTAVRNLERAGVPRSAAMNMTGHKTETIYRRYAIVDESMLRDAAERLAALHGADQQRAAATPKVVPIRK